MKKTLITIILALSYVFLHANDFNLKQYRNEYIYELYKYDNTDKEFKNDGTPYKKLLDTIGLLDYYCELKFKDELPDIILKKVKEKYMSQDLNLLIHEQKMTIAEDSVIYIKEPKNWISPTVYVSKELLDLEFFNIASFFIRGLAEYYYDITYDIELNHEIRAIKSKIFGIKIQAQLLEKLVYEDNQLKSEYESYILSSYINDDPKLYSFFYIVYAMDYLKYSEFFDLENNYDQTKYNDFLNNLILKNEENLNGINKLKKPDEFVSMNRYLHFVEIASFIYHSTIITEYFINLKYKIDEQTIKKYTVSLEKSNKYIKENRDEFESLRAMFTEKQYNFIHDDLFPF